MILLPIISSALFALAHYPYIMASGHLLSVLPIFVMGLSFCWMTYRSKNIVMAIAFHAAWDAMELLIQWPTFIKIQLGQVSMALSKKAALIASAKMLCLALITALAYEILNPLWKKFSPEKNKLPPEPEEISDPNSPFDFIRPTWPCLATPNKPNTFRAQNEGHDVGRDGPQDHYFFVSNVDLGSNYCITKVSCTDSLG